MRLIGHQSIANLFFRLARGDNLAQVYIFAGPEGVGKKYFAEVLAKEVQQGDSSGTRIWPLPPKIDEAREIKRWCARSSFSSPARIIIIDKIHLMGEPAAAALLKLLEEPHPNTHFFLITPFPSRVLSAVRSRAQIIRFSLVPRDDFRKAGLPDKDFEKYAFWWEGRPGYLLRLYYDKNWRQQFIQACSDCQEWLAGDLSRRFVIAERYSRLSREELAETLSVWLAYLRAQGVNAFTLRFFLRMIRALRTINIHTRTALEGASILL